MKLGENVLRSKNPLEVSVHNKVCMNIFGSLCLSISNELTVRVIFDCHRSTFKSLYSIK